MTPTSAKSIDNVKQSLYGSSFTTKHCRSVAKLHGRTIEIAVAVLRWEGLTSAPRQEDGTFARYVRGKRSIRSVSEASSGTVAKRHGGAGKEAEMILVNVVLSPILKFVRTEAYGLLSKD